MKKVMKAVAALMLITAVVFAAGCKKTDEPNNGSNNNGGNGGGGGGYHEYVDLGLPSGTLWATCNVGATTPESYGDYFAWGETTPKTTYDWSTYKYCNGGEGWNTLTKYCNSSYLGYNGFTDTLTVLQAGDDAATVNWGAIWHIPTKEQWQELKENTSNIWTIQDGVNGCLFTSSSGKELFLPAAGLNLQHNDGIGCYWSNSLYPYCSDSIWSFFFYPDGIYEDIRFYRSNGYSVRPVRSSQ